MKFGHRARRVEHRQLELDRAACWSRCRPAASTAAPSSCAVDRRPARPRCRCGGAAASRRHVGRGIELAQVLGRPHSHRPVLVAQRRGQQRPRPPRHRTVFSAVERGRRGPRTARRPARALVGLRQGRHGAGALSAASPRAPPRRAPPGRRAFRPREENVGRPAFGADFGQGVDVTALASRTLVAVAHQQG